MDPIAPAVRRGSGALLVLTCGIAACDRGCDGWFARHRAGIASAVTSESIPLHGVDCPDGLARCEEGVVSVSRLATLPPSCQSAAGGCQCPWEVASACSGGCAAEGVEVVIERPLAGAQLCAAGPDAAIFAVPSVGSVSTAAPLCDEGERYRCVGDGGVVECAPNVVVGRCVRGCFAQGASIDDDGVGREAAFAILCSR